MNNLSEEASKELEKISKYFEDSIEIREGCEGSVFCRQCDATVEIMDGEPERAAFGRIVHHPACALFQVCFNFHHKRVFGTGTT